jgi:predicted lactoylglutathione lyase
MLHAIDSGADIRGNFQDPDGHLWEIAWNPAWEVKE